MIGFYEFSNVLKENLFLVHHEAINTLLGEKMCVYKTYLCFVYIWIHTILPLRPPPSLDSQLETTNLAFVCHIIQVSQQANSCVYQGCLQDLQRQCSGHLHGPGSLHPSLRYLLSQHCARSSLG